MMITILDCCQKVFKKKLLLNCNTPNACTKVVVYTQINCPVFSGVKAGHRFSRSKYFHFHADSEYAFRYF